MAFIIGIASVWARGITIDCGCFGGGGYDADAASQYPWEIARDVGLAGALGRTSSGRAGPDSPSTTSSSGHAPTPTSTRTSTWIDDLDPDLDLSDDDQHSGV